MSDEERIERLLRLADPGPEIPAGGEARITTAVRPLWRQQVRRRTARRVALSASITAAAAAALFFVVAVLRRPEPAAPLVPVARVELVRGPVDATFRQTTLFAGSRLHTSPASRAALRVVHGASLRLDSDTTIRLLSAHVVELERGAIYIDSGDRQTMEVRTPFGSVRDLGTRFEVRVEERLLVRVREGSVQVATSARAFRVNAGFESIIGTGGPAAISAIASDGESWTAAVAPPFEIEGQSVASLLDWCSRESGLAVRYRDGDAERAARTTLLHGEAHDLQPLEAADVILPTAGLQAMRGKGELVVGVRPPPR